MQYKRLAERRDIPTWWKDGPDVHVCEARTYDSTRTCTGSYYPKLHDHLRTFRGKSNGPVVAMLAGWENHRHWIGGDYFPVFDADQAKSVIQQFRQDGFRPLWQSQHVPQEFVAELQPPEVLFVELCSSGKTAVDERRKAR